jgi:hypothetical protein
MSDDKVVPFTGPHREEDLLPEIGDPNLTVVNLPMGLENAVGDLGFEDIDAAFNMRDWLQRACEAQGAKMTGGGFGGGEADISIELEGHEYWLTIKPIKC